jgi:pyruvate dehydrogenase E1 component beta subunit
MAKYKFLSYAEAINQATSQSMKFDKNIILLGQLVDYQSGVFGTTSGLIEKFGKERVRDFPVAESLMTSMALGLTTAKKRTILVHHRLDFMFYSMDAIVNWISLWKFKSGNKNTKVPIVIRAIIGKGWGQGPQHSKSVHSWFANLPGVRVALPTNSFDAKGLLIESIFSNIPTIIIEHRSLFQGKTYVPEQMYRIKFGKANLLKRGKDISIVCIGYIINDAMKASELLKKEQNIDIEVIDIRTLNPIDKTTISKSIKKTGRLLVLDSSWTDFGASSEVITLMIENYWKFLKHKPERLAFPNSHTPMSFKMERKYYPDYRSIIKKIRDMLKK